MPELSKDELVVVMDIVDDQKILGEKIGEIKATDNGLSNNCSYYENINNLKELARQSGANLIKITRHKPADKFSTCHRLWANIYIVENAKVYETEIEWSANRKLTWEDFKGQPDIENFPNALAVTNSGFGYESGSLSFFKEGKLFVRNLFYNHGSWVLPKGKTDYVLRHEQIHFDITEIYTRILRKALIDANITTNNSNRAQLIFESIKNDWQKRQEDYDYKTQHGLKKETQEEWEAIVTLELARYDLYKSN
ncbi:hypothetical protein [Thalassobellus suaedae]|uniref:DUF922 domain-containing protein n=1 Tax=Thalassobellus suaedae TaxID=3074124 RepID=A0ABY9Y3K6_9FLAO|nr:hypothetical protein RHP49_00840 [Flavobacteriaceae bacterium HL-DH10]